LWLRSYLKLTSGYAYSSNIGKKIKNKKRKSVNQKFQKKM